MIWGKKFAVVMATVSAFSAYGQTTPVSERGKKPWEGSPFSGDAKAIIQAASGEKDDSAEAVILLCEDVFSYDTAGRTVYSRHLVLKIQNASGIEQWSGIGQPWSPWHQERPRLRARVINPDGTVHELDLKTIDESPAHEGGPDLHNDQRVLSAPLPGLVIGSVIEQEIVLRDTATFFERGSSTWRSLEWGVPVRTARLVIEYPDSLPLKYKSYLLAKPEPRLEAADGVSVLTFEAHDLSPVKDIEGWVPSDVPRVASVEFSTGRSWAEVASAYSAIVDAKIAGANLASLIATLPKKATRNEKIEKLTAVARKDVRYTGLEFGEAAIVPANPAETLKRKFGDCKDKATLLVASLRGAGIPANVALLSVGPGWDVSPELPGIGEFDHAIVYIPGPPAIWIDPTVEFARAGELPIPDLDRQALVAATTTKGLIRTPPPVSTANVESENREFFLAEDGPSRVVETTETTGPNSLYRRAFYRDTDNKELRKTLEEYVKDEYLAKELGDFTVSDPQDLTKPLRIQLEAKTAKRGVTFDRGAIVGIPITPLIGRLPEAFIQEESKPRKADFEFSNPFTVERRYRIVAPLGFVARQVPESSTTKLGTAIFAQTYAMEKDGAVSAVLRLDTGKRRLTPDEFTTMREKVREFIKTSPVQIDFEQVGEAHLAAGRVREAIEEFTKLTIAHPKEALHQGQIARALLAGGMGEEARRHASLATQIEPNSATGFRTLGWVLQHDLIGRRFGKGFDHPGAIAAYRKAKELDKEDWASRADLAILLEHDADGNRYTAKSNLAEAIEEYRALRTSLKEERFDDNLLIALLHARRWEDVKKEAPNVKNNGVRSLATIVALAQTLGAQAGIADALRRIASGDERRQALGSAAQTLLDLRDYQLAATIFEEAAKGAPNANAIHQLVLRLRDLKHWEERSLPESDPATVVKRMLLLTFDPSTTLETFAALFSKQTMALTTSDKDAREELENALQMVAGRTRDQGISPDGAKDMGLGAARAIVEGDDTSGYVVRMQREDSNRGSELIYYVVKEEGAYRILALQSSIPAVGLEALRLAETGDLTTAGKWLDRLREQIVPPGGDDPLLGNPFARLWEKGAQGTLETVRVAAMSLLVGTPQANRAIEILIQARGTVTDPTRLAAIDIALTRAYGQLEKWPEALDVSSRLLKQYPRSDVAFVLTTSAMFQSDKVAEIEPVVQARLKTIPDDPLAIRTLAEVLVFKNDLNGAAKLLRQQVERGKADESDYNQLAWMALFRGPIGEQELKDAQAAVEKDEYGGHAILHTLATIYAEAGKTAEAYQIIIKAVDATPKGEPNDADWYVFGRLAEHYGLPDVARSMYAKVLPPKSKLDAKLSTTELVKMRLSILDKKQGTGKKKQG